MACLHVCCCHIYSQQCWQFYFFVTGINLLTDTNLFSQKTKAHLSLTLYFLHVLCCCPLEQHNCLPSSTRPHHSADLKDIHWLPVHGRVNYKIAVLCYKAVKLQQLSYLTGLLSSYRQSRVLRSSTSDLLSTQSSFFKHCWNLLLVGSHAAPPLFGTVFPHLYTLLTVSLVLGLSSRLTCSQDICTAPLKTLCRLCRFFVHYTFVTCLLTHKTS